MTTNGKEWIQYSTATLMVVSGVVLSFISFFTKGDVTDGVLWYMAQGLTFLLWQASLWAERAGAIFGVSVYFKTKLGESENRIREFINDKFKDQGGNRHENNQ